MSFLPSVAIFCELQLVHETGYFLPQPTLEECWQQVTGYVCLSSTSKSIRLLRLN